MVELREENVPASKNFVRIERRMFQDVLTRLGDRIEKDTGHRNENPPALKDTITLRHLAKGASYHCNRYNFRVANNTISLIVRDVCEASIALVYHYLSHFTRGVAAGRCSVCGQIGVSPRP